MARYETRPDLRLWKNDTKFAWVGALAGKTKRGHVVLAGAHPVELGLFPGSADIVGIRFADARWIWIEVKTGDADLEPAQLRAYEMMERAGALVCVARSLGDVDALLGVPV